jgi:hypothetical protein
MRNGDDNKVVGNE